MEREQATLPFVVPSHLSRLFGLKASVIVEGEGAGERDERERQREGVLGANSTCWGDGETAVMGKITGALYSLCVFLSFPPSLCLSNRFHLCSSHLQPLSR